MFFQLNSRFTFIYRILSAVLGIKYHDDKYYSNKYYASVAGVSLEHLNAMERILFRYFKHNLFYSVRKIEEMLLEILPIAGYSNLVRPSQKPGPFQQVKGSFHQYTKSRAQPIQPSPSPSPSPSPKAQSTQQKEPNSNNTTTHLAVSPQMDHTSSVQQPEPLNKVPSEPVTENDSTLKSQTTILSSSTQPAPAVAKVPLPRHAHSFTVAQSSNLFHSNALSLLPNWSSLSERYNLFIEALKAKSNNKVNSSNKFGNTDDKQQEKTLRKRFRQMIAPLNPPDALSLRLPQIASSSSSNTPDSNNDRPLNSTPIQDDHQTPKPSHSRNQTVDPSSFRTKPFNFAAVLHTIGSLAGSYTHRLTPSASPNAETEPTKDKALEASVSQSLIEDAPTTVSLSGSVRSRSPTPPPSPVADLPAISQQHSSQLNTEINLHSKPPPISRSVSEIPVRTQDKLNTLLRSSPPAVSFMIIRPETVVSVNENGEDITVEETVSKEDNISNQASSSNDIRTDHGLTSVSQPDLSTTHQRRGMHRRMLSTASLQGLELKDFPQYLVHEPPTPPSYHYRTHSILSQDINEAVTDALSASINHLKQDPLLSQTLPDLQNPALFSNSDSASTRSDSAMMLRQYSSLDSSSTHSSHQNQTKHSSLYKSTTADDI